MFFSLFWWYNVVFRCLAIAGNTVISHCTCIVKWLVLTINRSLTFCKACVGLSSVGDIIPCSRLGLFGHEARLDSDVPPRDALECAYARHIEIHPPLGWRRPQDVQGRLGCTWLVMALQPPSAKNGNFQSDVDILVNEISSMGFRCPSILISIFCVPINACRSGASVAVRHQMAEIDNVENWQYGKCIYIVPVNQCVDAVGWVTGRTSSQ